MGVLIVATLRFTDVARYRRYQARFPEVFRGSGGEVLAADEQPQRLTGGSVDKIVVMRFDSEPTARAFLDSPAYKEISVDRDAGAEVESWIVKAF